MRFYFKAVRAYFGRIVLPDEDEKDEYRSNIFTRYGYYTLDDLMIVDPATGCYVRRSMPAPFCWPGKIGWRLVHVWQTKIAKTHI